MTVESATAGAATARPRASAARAMIDRREGFELARLLKLRRCRGAVVMDLSSSFDWDGDPSSRQA
jgi:hypothetical protein